LRKSEHFCDFLVLGGGAAGLTGALAARLAGLDVLLAEKEAWVGGATALSGGTIWLPGSHILAQNGIADSREDGLRYLDALIGPDQDAIDRDRVTAFVREAPAFAAFLDEQGLALRHARGWSDYYAELPGGLDIGRTLYCDTFDLRELGADEALLAPGALFSAAHSIEVSKMALGVRSFEAARIALRVAARSVRAKATGARLATRGKALIGRMLRAVRRSGVDLWCGARLVELLVENERAVGAVLDRDGTRIRVVARKGILLATGGFARDALLRARYQAPVGIDATMAPGGDTGDGIRAARDAGATLSMMEEAWWVPGTKTPTGPMVHVWDRCFPHSLVVDTQGERYMDEAGPYMEVGQQMIARHAKLDTDHSWLILESRHRNRYSFGMAPPMITPAGWIESGFLIRAGSIEELAGQMDVEPDRLCATLDHFNRGARAGRDDRYGRGTKAISRYYGDWRVKPNPNLGPVEQPPFYAVRLYPGDVGTAGGVRTDAHGRVLDSNLRPIAGLYAAGNTASGIFGPCYPGAGASIAPGMLFGMQAARHAAQEAA
jgi:3-oxosteroid 1-dehydrogenase